VHHAIESGSMRREDVHSELSDIVSGRLPAREGDIEVIVFDSTGRRSRTSVTSSPESTSIHQESAVPPG
jgi:ornithine cyclodeaminase/alanine dehydrogenase